MIDAIMKYWWIANLTIVVYCAYWIAYDIRTSQYIWMCVMIVCAAINTASCVYDLHKKG